MINYLKISNMSLRCHDQMKVKSQLSRASFHGWKRKAFTLVETVIAMGIVAFAMLGILGMVPVGLTNFREAMSNTAESQIVQGLSNDILLTKYSDLLDAYGTGTNVTYYSEEGKFLEGANGSDPANAFEVKVSLAGISAPRVNQDSGRTVQIEVTKIKSSLPGKKYSFIVPRG